jgi:hypothetical protein
MKVRNEIWIAYTKNPQGCSREMIPRNIKYSIGRAIVR